MKDQYEELNEAEQFACTVSIHYITSNREVLTEIRLRNETSKCNVNYSRM